MGRRGRGEGEWLGGKEAKGRVRIRGIRTEKYKEVGGSRGQLSINPEARPAWLQKSGIEKIKLRLGV